MTFAHAQSSDPTARIKEHYTNAQENYDILEFEDARTLLKKALVIVKKNNIDAQWIAKIHAFYAVVEFVGFENKKQAHKHLRMAVKANRRIRILRDYTTPELNELLITVKRSGSKRKSKQRTRNIITDLSQEDPLLNQSDSNETQEREESDDDDTDEDLLSDVLVDDNDDVESNHTNTSPRFVLYGDLGTGFAILQGNTEQVDPPAVIESGGIAPAYAHFHLGIGYLITPSFTLGIMGRLGLTLGANVENASSGTAAGFIRGTYSITDYTQGFQLSAFTGMGLIRNVVEIASANETTEAKYNTAATGPLLGGVGVTYLFAINQSYRFYIGADVFGNIPIETELLSDVVLTDYGIQFDLNAGIQLVF